MRIGEFDGLDGANGVDGVSGSVGAKGRRKKVGDGLTKGGKGGNGGKGKHGRKGSNAKTVRVHLRVDGERIIADIRGLGPRAITEPFDLVAIGGDGGRGGNGGRGGAGGKGDPRGADGQNGPGGNGGDAGDGGDILVTAEDPLLLTFIQSMESKGGSGGKAGRGSPKGAAGTHGTNGLTQLEYKPKEGLAQRDQRIGLELVECKVSDQRGTLEPVARGGVVLINSVLLRNLSNIQLNPPFQLRVSTQGAVESAFELNIESEHPVPSHGTLEVHVAHVFTVPQDAVCGRLNFEFQLWAIRGNQQIPLHLRPIAASIQVNHRFPNNDETARYLNSLLYSDQVATCTAVFLANLIPPEEVSGKRIAKSAKSVLAHLQHVDFNHKSVVKAIQIYSPRFSAVPREGLLEIAAQFFVDKPTAREQLIHAAIRAVVSDKVIDASEKEALFEMAEVLGLGRDWLRIQMPAVQEAGDSKVAIRRTNTLGQLLVPVLFGGVSIMFCELILWMGIAANEPMDLSSGVLAITFAIPTVAVIASGSLLRKECPNCQSTQLVEESSQGNLAACQACGTRASSVLRGDQSVGFRNSSWDLGGRTDAILVGGTTLLASLICALDLMFAEPSGFFPIMLILIPLSALLLGGLTITVLRKGHLVGWLIFSCFLILVSLGGM